MDCDYSSRESGSYSVENIPMDDLQKIYLTNISNISMQVSIPILKKLTVDYIIEPGMTAEIPNTELSNYFVRTSLDMDNVTYKIL